MLYLICYDISDDRRRTKVANLLLAYGWRVQRSVFEADLSDRQRQILERKALKAIDPRQDQLRLYPLSKPNRANVRILGIPGDPIAQASHFIV